MNLPLSNGQQYVILGHEGVALSAFADQQCAPLLSTGGAAADGSHLALGAWPSRGMRGQVLTHQPGLGLSTLVLPAAQWAPQQLSQRQQQQQHAKTSAYGEAGNTLAQPGRLQPLRQISPSCNTSPMEEDSATQTRWAKGAPSRGPDGARATATTGRARHRQSAVLAPARKRSVLLVAAEQHSSSSFANLG